MEVGDPASKWTHPRARRSALMCDVKRPTGGAAESGSEEGLPFRFVVSVDGLAIAGHPRMAWPSPLKPKLSE